MNIENDRVAIGFISLIIIASGCSHAANSGGAEASAQGVVVENFSVIPQNSFSEQPTDIQLEVINLGEKDAQNVEAEIKNVPIGDGEDQWDLERWGEGPSELLAADSDSDIPARSDRFSWSSDAPSISPGLELDYNFRTSVYYEYGSTATTTLNLMSSEQFREEGRMGRPTMDNTDGPVHLEIRTRQPMIFGQDERVCVIVRNEGIGTPFYDESNFGSYSQDHYEDISDEEFETVKISIDSHPGVELVDGAEREVDLVRGEGQACYNIEPNDDEQDRLEVPLEINADYGYVVDDATEAVVTGSERFS